MGPRRRRRLFGPLFYAMVALAIVEVVGLAVWERLPGWRQYCALRSYAGALRSPDFLVRIEAQNALVHAGEDGVTWLVDAAGDRDPEVRRRAITSLLSHAGVLSPTALPAILAGLSDPDVEVRRLSATGLSSSPPGHREVAERLTRALDDADLDVRFHAAVSLMHLSAEATHRRVLEPEDRPAVRTLLALIGDPDPTHLPDRGAVAGALWGTSPEAQSRAVERLIPLTPSKSVPFRRAAIEGLSRLAHYAKPATACLERALKDEDRIVRWMAALALTNVEGWGRVRTRPDVTDLAADLAAELSLSAWLRAELAWALGTDNGSPQSRQPEHVLHEVIGFLKQADAQSQAIARALDDDPMSVEPR